MTSRHGRHLPAGILAALWLVSTANAGSLVAYSLGQAEARLLRGDHEDLLMKLGRITRPIGMVVEDDARDIIVVGERCDDDPGMSLEDLAVALRARFVYKAWPLVSIDPTPDTPRTKVQTVRFAGGLEGTRFGRELLDADVSLKKLALGLTAAQGGALRSYADLSVQEAGKEKPGHTVTSRFWFFPVEPALSKREGVFALRSIKMGVRAETVDANANPKGPSSRAVPRDGPAEEFSRTFTSQMGEIVGTSEEIKRLNGLYALVALARGMEDLVPREKVRYWVSEFKIPFVATRETYDLVVREKEVAKGSNRRIRLSGGIELKAIILRLRDGDVTALREAVLRSRPDGNSLTWRLPLEGWVLRSSEAGEQPDDSPVSAATPPGANAGKLGCSVTREMLAPGQPVSAMPALPGNLPGIDEGKRVPDFRFLDRLAYQPARGQIGGVMLCNTARAEGLDGSQVTGASADPASGTFALMVQGRNVAVRQADLRKFVTALWAVYFGKEDPGISIDPISPESDHQLVRIIGNIAETHLAKVLLDADYYMKQCAVGTKNPGIRGFHSVDELSGQKGVRVRGAGQRFWFVPESMSFRLCGDALLFDGGRMTVKTEYMFVKGKPATAEPAGEAFAKFWTDHYWEFAAVNPVFEEMYEYARYTALAKYLKQSGANLQWFLMANRHLVLDERMPGTVPTLRAPSRVLRGVQWFGGVDLGVDMSFKQPGRYIVDQTAAAAIRQGLARQSTAGGGGGARSSPSASPGAGGFSTLGDRPVEAKLPEGTYTMMPAVGLTAGTGAGKVTYHTDLSLRSKGEPGVELVRFNRPGGADGALGRCWDLYLPYRLKLAAESGWVKVKDMPVLATDGTITKVDARMPEQMDVVDQVTGKAETLVLSADRYDTISWVPRAEAKGRLRAMTFSVAGAFVLVEKSGCRFLFSPDGRMCSVLFSDGTGMRYRYEGSQVVRMTDFSGGQVDLAYEGGRVHRASSGQAWADYRYSGDELSCVRYSDGRRLVFIYNADGSLNEVVSRADKALADAPAPAAVPGPEVSRSDGARPEASTPLCPRQGPVPDAKVGNGT